MCKLILNKKNYAIADLDMGGLGAPSSIGQKYGLVEASSAGSFAGIGGQASKSN